jgi:ParB family chromosome partitioning protein
LTKLELAIIENLQREDLNAIDRAKALQKLIQEFGISHGETAAKIGKSREYVSNSLRLLSLPEDMQQAIANKEITEGHARALLALNDRPEERETLFREITLKRLSVRAAERIARSIAQERVRKYHRKSPEMVALEKTLTETLGTRVIIETNVEGGRLLIDFFSPDDLTHLVTSLTSDQKNTLADAAAAALQQNEGESAMPIFPNTTQITHDPVAPAAPEEESEDELYSVTSFSV